MKRVLLRGIGGRFIKMASRIAVGYYVMAIVDKGKVTKVVASHVKLTEVLRAMAVHGKTQADREGMKVLQRTADGYKAVRLLGQII